MSDRTIKRLDLIVKMFQSIISVLLGLIAGTAFSLSYMLLITDEIKDCKPLQACILTIDILVLGLVVLILLEITPTEIDASDTLNPQESHQRLPSIPSRPKSARETRLSRRRSRDSGEINLKHMMHSEVRGSKGLKIDLDLCMTRNEKVCVLLGSSNHGIKALAWNKGPRQTPYLLDGVMREPLKLRYVVELQDGSVIRLDVGALIMDHEWKVVDEIVQENPSTDD